jgi:flagellar motility protein MotE (MotC chaperone)
MITATGQPLTERLRAAFNRRTAQVLEAEREIARLQQRIIALQTENELLSHRLAQAEGANNESDN